MELPSIQVRVLDNMEEKTMKGMGEGCSEVQYSANGSTEKLFQTPINIDGSGDENLEIDIEESKEIDASENIESVEALHSRIPEEYTPVIGMEFKSEEEAYEYYKSYALRAGFGVRKSKSHRDEKKCLLDRTFCCSREGIRGKDKRDAYRKSHRSESRCGCLASMKINARRTGMYRIEKFIAEHNHALSSSSMSHLHRSHRKISEVQAAVAEIAESSGIRPKETTEFMAKQAGGRENLGYIHQDYKNHLQTKRTREMKLSDTGGVLEYLQGMKLKDSNFFYALQVDSDALITNIFWADARMILDYSFFGDVVCFDTTYKKHKDGRPVALFVGVNHHKQSVIFAAALLYDETIATFEWLFRTFADAMGKKPITVLTDQAQAIANALSSQWPDTHHRLCIWHIYQNAAIHLSSVLARFKLFSRDFSNCLYDCEEEEIFISSWNEMLDKYNLHDNDWLKRMFKIKEKWALVYGRQYFCADMITTQRSESMNNVIKKYISYTYDMHRFFEHFQRLIDDRRDEELRADFRASQSTPSLPFHVQILKHAASIYTPEVFKLFQNEWGSGHDCTMEVSHEDGMVTEYKVTPYHRHQQRIVTYDSTNDTIICSCKKYEFSGILCSHALKVLTFKNVTRIPSPYILKRWTKKAKMGSMTFDVDVTNVADRKTIMAIRYKELCLMCNRLVIRAAETDESYSVAKNSLTNLLQEVEQSVEEKATNKSAPCDEGFSVPTNIKEDNGKPINGIKKKEKVCGQTNKRLKSCLEKGKRKRRAKGMQSTDADVTQGTCPNLEEISFPSVMFVEEPTDGHVIAAQDRSSLSQIILPSQESIGVHHGHTNLLSTQTSSLSGILSQEVQQPIQPSEGLDLNFSWYCNQ